MTGGIEARPTGLSGRAGLRRLVGLPHECRDWICGQWTPPLEADPREQSIGYSAAISGRHGSDLLVAAPRMIRGPAARLMQLVPRRRRALLCTSLQNGTQRYLSDARRRPISMRVWECAGLARGRTIEDRMNTQYKKRRLMFNGVPTHADALNAHPLLSQARQPLTTGSSVCGGGACKRSLVRMTCPSCASNRAQP